MALTITQETDFRVIVPTVTNVDLLLRPGHSISNTSRAGEGIVTGYVNAGFVERSGCANFTILVLSGDFQNGDSFTNTPTGAGTISTVTVATYPGILVTGTMPDTDSTTNTNEALDADEVDITVLDSSVLRKGMILRIDDTVDEYSLIEIIPNATTITVKRGLFGTGGTHTTGKDIYIVDTDLYEQILDADVTGGWGYSDTTNGRIEFDCNLICGSPQQTSNSILITSMENLDLSMTDTNNYYQMGNETYRTYFQNGLGYLSEVSGDWDGFASRGSIIKTPGVGTTFTPCVNCTSYFFSATIDGAINFRGKTISYDMFLSSVDNAVINLGHTEVSKGFNTFCNLTSVNAATALFESKILKIYGSSTNFIYSFADVTLREMETDERVAGSGFLAAGTKTQIDCKTQSSFDIFGTFGFTFDNFKSFNCNVIGEDGEPIEGANVVCNYRIDNTDNIFSVPTDADGITEEQLIRFEIAPLLPAGFVHGVPQITATRNIEIFVRKSGYKEYRYRRYIGDRDDPIVLKDIVLKKKRFIETKSVGGI